MLHIDLIDPAQVDRIMSACQSLSLIDRVLVATRLRVPPSRLRRMRLDDRNQAIREAATKRYPDLSIRNKAKALGNELCRSKNGELGRIIGKDSRLSEHAIRKILGSNVDTFKR